MKYLERITWREAYEQALVVQSTDLSGIKTSTHDLSAFKASTQFMPGVSSSLHSHAVLL